MRQDAMETAEQYKKAHQRKNRWYKVVTCLAAVVVFCTTYALILPAITMETKCDIPEHTHTESCYTQVTTVTKKVPVCTAESLGIHQHTDACYDSEGTLICGYADFVIHRHDASCYDENGKLWCPLPETEAHQHTESCYAESELICGQGEIVPHTHQPYQSPENPGCYDEHGELACGQLEVTEHQHTDACFETVEEPADTTTLTCTNTDSGHVHTDMCYGTWELTCGMEEHSHTDACRTAAAETELTEEEQARVEEVIALIDALPTSEEIEAQLTALEEAEDWDGYEAYFLETSCQAKTAYAYYEDLGPELQQSVPNADKLWDLAWLWSAQTLAITDTLTVYQINSYSQAATTLVYGGSVRDKLGGGMSYTYWDVVVVEKDSSGKLYVDRYITADGDKRDCKASTADGFVLLLYNTSANVSVGDEVSARFDYKTTGTYNSQGYGTVNFGTDLEQKPGKDNTEKLTTIPGADTRDIIEINLYDYGSNINDLYNSNNKYPGFQQDNGSINVGESFSKWASFNFGNNITADLAAGKANITNQGGAINTTTNGANSPISGAMQTTLGSDGYPALSDGTSLGYLFSDGTYATKKNNLSINGLFQYNETTGAYTFNSRENHAQFNAGSDTFTLYQQILTSNFMMYPFGNFLPFNDIVHLSAQTSTIDKAYLETIANSAQYKYNKGEGNKYGTLATQLKKFINLMDGAYPDEWTGVNCMNEYFEAAEIPRRFTNNETLVQNLYSIDYDEPTDFYFGMEMKMNFMQPKGGLTGKDGQQPMVFYFTGDDDVWVYIDGALFLDLSGIHRHVGGEIDFVNGEVKYYSLDVSTGDVSTTPYKTVEFSELVDPSLLNEKGTFKDYSTHSFNFYYMERGSGSGVCRMNFNFPLLRKNTISVTKELSVDEQDKQNLLGNPDFRFQVLKENGTDLFIGGSVSYDIQDTAGNKIGTGTTDENGVFTLKANQTAVFSNISENAGKYFVRELLDPDAFEQYGTITVDGSSQTTNYDVTVGADTFKGINSPVKDVSDGSTAFHFNNQVTFNKLGSLSITKTLTEYTPARSASQFTFEVTLDGSPLPVGTTYTVGEETWTVETEGLLSLAPGETAVISHILAGTGFAVKETAASAEGYAVTYTVDGETQTGDGVSGVIKTEHRTAISVNNSEQGTSVTIPVQKVLNAPDGLTHTYTLHLEQVTSQTNLTPVDPAYTQELPLSITTEPVNSQFIIGYSQAATETLPAKIYYKITEKVDPNDTTTQFDASVYVVEVTVSDSGGALSATVTNVWKDENSVTEGTPTVVFTNGIIRYELPQTGGAGTTLYTVGGLLITTAAVFLLYSHAKRRKGDGKSS